MESGFGARNIYFRYNTTSGSVVLGVVELLDPENMGIAVGSLFLALLSAEILLLPV